MLSGQLPPSQETSHVVEARGASEGVRTCTNWFWALILCGFISCLGLLWVCFGSAFHIFPLQPHFDACCICSLHLSIGTHWHLACRVSERFKAPFHGTCMSLWELSGAAFWSGAWLQIAV